MGGKNPRTRGSGSLFERTINGKKVYVAQVELGRDPVTNARRRKTLYGQTKKELQERIVTTLNAVQTGAFFEATQITVQEYLGLWLDTHCSTKLKPKTVQSYQDMITRYIVPEIGPLKLCKLEPLHLETLYATQRSKGLGGRSVEYLHAILKSALNRAVRWRMLQRAVTADVAPPRYEKKQQVALEEHEIKRFLDVAKEHRLYALFLMAVTTGMRPGELLGITWDDVDLEQGLASISEAQVWLEDSKTPIYDSPKSNAGVRGITLPDVTVEQLRQHRLRQQEESKQHGYQGGERSLVFCTREGKPIRQSNLRRTVKRLFSQAGFSTVRDLTPYTLRRTHATYLISSGEDIKTVQSRMGHSTARMLLDVYAKTVASKTREPAKKFDQLLGEDTRSDEQGINSQSDPAPSDRRRRGRRRARKPLART